MRHGTWLSTWQEPQFAPQLPSLTSHGNQIRVLNNLILLRFHVQICGLSRNLWKRGFPCLVLGSLNPSLVNSSSLFVFDSPSSSLLLPDTRQKPSPLSRPSPPGQQNAVQARETILSTRRNEQEKQDNHIEHRPSRRRGRQGLATEPLGFPARVPKTEITRRHIRLYGSSVPGIESGDTPHEPEVRRRRETILALEAVPRRYPGRQECP